MTNEEAKAFLDNLKICINEHPVVADWLVEIADRKTEPITHDDYIETKNDHLEARCLNCNNAKACKEKHWEGCVYEPKDEKTCETCRYWKYIAHEWQCETTKCQGYTPKTENSSENPNNCVDCECTDDCTECKEAEHGCKTEPTGYNLSPVEDEPQTSRENTRDSRDNHEIAKDEPQRGCDADCNEDCTECAKEWQDWKDQMWAEAVIEPQTEVPRCSVNGTPYDECGFCEYFNCDTCRCEADEPQTDCPWK